jgi:WD40 repeat protein
VQSRDLLPQTYPAGGAAAFDADSSWLIVQDSQGLISFFNLQSQKLIETTDPYPSINGYEFSPDGKWLLGSIIENNGTNRLLVNMQDPQKYFVLSGHTDILTGSYFTPDGQSLLTFGFDGTIRIWDLMNPSLDPVVLRHASVIGRAMLSKNGKWLIADAYPNLYIWQWDFDDVQNLACRLVGRNLTRDEWAKYIGAKEYSKTCEQWP